MKYLTYGLTLTFAVFLFSHIFRSEAKFVGDSVIYDSCISLNNNANKLNITASIEHSLVFFPRTVTHA